MIQVLRILKYALVLCKPLEWLYRIVRKNKKASGITSITGIVTLIIALWSGEFKMEMLANLDWSTILVGVLSLGSALLGGKLVKVKKILKEVGEVIEAYNKANKDGKITPDEMKKIMKEVSDIYKVLKS